MTSVTGWQHCSVEIFLPPLNVVMEKGFYTWYEGVFDQCSSLVNGVGMTASEAKMCRSLGTLLFAGKFTSLSVVVRMRKSYDFVFAGAWANSFKAFAYRQQNYNHILYELYADQLSEQLVREHKNLYSFLVGHPLQERSGANKSLGNRLDQVLKVVLPTAAEAMVAGLDIRSIIQGVFLLDRQFVLVEGEDTLDALAVAGVKIEVVLEKSYTLGGKPALVKFAELDCFGVRKLVVVMPCFAEIDTLLSHVASLRQDVEVQLKSLHVSKMSASFVRPNYADQINP